MLLARLIRSGGATTFIAAFARLGLLLGALGFLAGAETLRWPGLGLFCLSGIILAALPLLRAAPRC
jgi:hypothetical protein